MILLDDPWLDEVVFAALSVINGSCKSTLIFLPSARKAKIINAGRLPQIEVDEKLVRIGGGGCGTGKATFRSIWEKIDLRPSLPERRTSFDPHFGQPPKIELVV